MDPSRGYPEAKRLLKENFRDDLKVTTAFMDKALKWATIKSDDGKALQSYALYLRSCCNAMQDLKMMEELDLPSNMKLIISKLPYRLKEKWRTTAYDILDRTGHRARFHDLVVFIEKQGKILLDPLFGDIQDRTKTAAISKLPAKPKSSNFSTTVAVVTDDCNIRTCSRDHSLQVSDISDSCTSCVFCDGKHNLKDCQKLKTQPHDAIVEFLKTKGFCFVCLLQGHMSKDCKRRITCKRCQVKHPTILHLDKSKGTFINTAHSKLMAWLGPEETVLCQLCQ